MKKLFAIMIVLATAMVARAFDFSAVAPTGQSLGYTITSASTVTVAGPDGGNSSLVGRLEIPSSVTNSGTTYTVSAIDNSAFRNCTALTAVSIPGSVATIGYTAFMGCSVLTSVQLDEGIAELGRMAFANCPQLDTIGLPSTLRQIGAAVFNGTAYLNDSTNWTGMVLYIGPYVILTGNLVDTAVTIVEGTLGIANAAMSYCHYMPKLTLPSTLLFIGTLAFSDCEVLDTVVLHAAQPPLLTYDAFQGVPSPTVVVPCGSLAAYSADAQWGAMNPVEDTCPVGVTTAVDATEPQLLAVSGGIVVRGAQGMVVTVSDVMGRTLCSVTCSAEQRIALPARGIYIVSVEGATPRKVACYWK